MIITKEKIQILSKLHNISDLVDITYLKEKEDSVSIRIIDKSSKRSTEVVYSDTGITFKDASSPHLCKAVACYLFFRLYTI